MPPLTLALAPSLARSLNQVLLCDGNRRELLYYPRQFSIIIINIYIYIAKTPVLEILPYLSTVAVVATRYALLSYRLYLPELYTLYLYYLYTLYLVGR